MTDKIRVLIVDDSAVIRQGLSRELSRYKDIEVVGTALDPFVARDKIVRLEPDVLTLDIEMPRMNGLAFLGKLMKFYPMPVVIMSSLTRGNQELACKALSMGAVEVIPKPEDIETSRGFGRQIVQAIRAANAVKMHTYKSIQTAETAPPVKGGSYNKNIKMIAIGASTGGTLAIETILKQLPVELPGIVIVQHMPAGMTDAFAQRLDTLTDLTVFEANDGDTIKPGTVAIAPGGLHMMVHGQKIQIKKGPPVHHQRPSVDVLLHSVADSIGNAAVGIVLTGMGADGADGLLAMRQAGAHTAAQDQSSSVVYGMPREAARKGGAETIVALQDVAEYIIQQVQE